MMLQIFLFLLLLLFLYSLFWLGIYTVIDQPNVQDQPHSNYAQNLTREILKEVLPYMNIYPDEEQTGVNADLTITGANPPTGEKVTQEGEQGE